ncbi:MAG: hypothetical protein ACQESR_07415 [Planctomycetota bacterium]
MESCPTQAVLPLVGLAAEKVIRDRYITGYRTVGRLFGKRRTFGWLSLPDPYGFRNWWNRRQPKTPKKSRDAPHFISTEIRVYEACLGVRDARC